LKEFNLLIDLLCLLRGIKIQIINKKLICFIYLCKDILDKLEEEWTALKTLIWRRWKWSSIPIIHSFKLSYCISPKNKLNNKLNANAMAAFQFSSSFLKCWFYSNLFYGPENFICLIDCCRPRWSEFLLALILRL
jgi:hypothetical protein